jgi:glycosyltransferase involved in cell wall biosynthesis
MRLSVALCTYNGEKHLAEQLASVRDQSRPPDELVVCDDVSSDRSPQIVREFATTVSFPVRVELNEQNLGSTLNFARAISLCAGDAIVLADQDDIWLPHKLATLERALTADSTIGLVFSDAEVVGENLEPLGYRLWEAIQFRPREQARFRRGEVFEGLLRRYRVTGATLAFRATYRELVLPIPPEWVHDAWIALLISAVARCELIADPLIRYRQHSRQQHGGQKRGLYTQYLAATALTQGRLEAVADRYTAALDRLGVVPGVGENRLGLLRRKVEHYRQRAAMRAPGVWRLPSIVREMWRGHYSRFSLGWKTIAQDLMLG